MSKESSAKFEVPKRTFTLEFWVGAFTLAGVLCFSYLAINLAGMKISNAGLYEVSAVFTNIAGLKVGAPVEIAGVRIGEVSGVKLEATEARVSMQIRNGVNLREDDIAQIRTKGIIGDKYVKISPGGSEDLLKPGDSISDTESAVELEEVIGKVVHSLDSK